MVQDRWKKRQRRRGWMVCKRKRDRVKGWRGERVNPEVAAERVFIIRTDQGTQRPGLPLMMLYSRLARSLVPTRTRLAFSRIYERASSTLKDLRSLKGEEIGAIVKRSIITGPFFPLFYSSFILPRPCSFSLFRSTTGSFNVPCLWNSPLVPSSFLFAPVLDPLLRSLWFSFALCLCIGGVQNALVF